MKNRIVATNPNQPNRREKLIATFGRAQLVRSHGGVELRGGNTGDHTNAKEWASLFMHEAIIRTAPAPKNSIN